MTETKPLFPDRYIDFCKSRETDYNAARTNLDSGTQPISPQDLPDFLVPGAPTKTLRLIHYLVGILTELEELKLCFNKVDIDRVNLSEELGDLGFYLCLLCDLVEYEPSMEADYTFDSRAMLYTTHSDMCTEVVRMFELVRPAFHRLCDMDSIQSEVYASTFTLVALYCELMCRTCTRSRDVQKDNIAKLSKRYTGRSSDNNGAQFTHRNIQRELDAIQSTPSEEAGSSDR